MERKTITIKKEIWKKLAQLKLDLDFSSFDDLFEYFMKKEDQE